MAVVYVCDKCGKIMQIKEKRYEIEITGVHLPEYECYHVCEKCINIIKDFIKKEESNGSLGNNRSTR